MGSRIEIALHHHNIVRQYPNFKKKPKSNTNLLIRLRFLRFRSFCSLFSLLFLSAFSPFTFLISLLCSFHLSTAHHKARFFYVQYTSLLYLLPAFLFALFPRFLRCFCV